MKSLLCTICCLIIIPAFFNSKPRIKVDDVVSLKFYTTSRTFERNFSIRDFEYFVKWNKDSVSYGSICRDTTVFTRSSIEKFINYVNNLKISKNNTYDLRTAVAINMKNGSTKYVGFGYLFGTCFEGLGMKDDKRLFKYLEDSIYSAHPREYWMGEWEKKFNSGYFDYVNDTLTGIKAYTSVKIDSDPKYKGSINGFYDELDKLLPTGNDKNSSTEGEIYVQFIITKNGRLVGPRISGKQLKELNEKEKALLDVINKMQDWEPGTYKGIPVDVFMNMPVLL